MRRLWIVSGAIISAAAVITKGLNKITSKLGNVLADEAGSIKLGKGIVNNVDDAIGAVNKGGSKIASNKAIVIGEGMGDIKTVAKQLQSEGINAKWYQAWNKNFPANRPITPEELNSALSRNQRWIDSKIKQGYEIYDIGINPVNDIRSPFFAIEQSRITKFDYPTIDIKWRRP